MGRLPEYDHVEREALRKGISRQPDPLPRGAVVAGEQREVEGGAGEGELEVVAWALQELGDDATPDPSFTGDADHAQRLDCSGRFAVEPLTPLLPAQERIRALEARLEQEVVERRLKESALARVDELEEAVAEMGARLEELRPVVRAAIQYKHQEPFFEPVQALSPATREWAEGEET